MISDRAGNYLVKIFKDGSKVRFTLDDYYNPSFPESIDIKITNYCDNNCPMCHEKSSVNGNHGNLDALFLKTLTKGTELAIGGGNPFAHPDLENFLLNIFKFLCPFTEYPLPYNPVLPQLSLIPHYFLPVLPL